MLQMPPILIYYYGFNVNLRISLKDKALTPCGVQLLLF